jgi:hypothetical protein
MCQNNGKMEYGEMKVLKARVSVALKETVDAVELRAQDRGLGWEGRRDATVFACGLLRRTRRLRVNGLYIS